MGAPSSTVGEFILQVQGFGCGRFQAYLIGRVLNLNCRRCTSGGAPILVQYSYPCLRMTAAAAAAVVVFGAYLFPRFRLFAMQQR